MNEIYERCGQMTSEDSNKSTFSQVSEDGRAPSNSPDGETNAHAGPVRSRASRSAIPEIEEEQMILDISGLSCLRLIRECRPECILGEQVPGAVRLGWLDRISTDLEAEDYAVGTTVLGAHSAGAPHIRNRIWWGARRLGDSKSKHYNGKYKVGKESQEPGRKPSILARCADGKIRRISPEPCDVPMADGLSKVMGSRSAAQAPGRTGMLRGYGNAIVPETGAIFARAWMGEVNER